MGFLTTNKLLAVHLAQPIVTQVDKCDKENLFSHGLNRRDRKRLLERKLEEEIIDSDTNNNNDNNKILEDSASQDEIVLRTCQGGRKTTGLDNDEEKESPKK